MSTKRAVAGRIGNLDLDGAFTEAEARSLAGKACEIWCLRDRSGRPVAYRVVASQQVRDVRLPWEQIALFLAVGRGSQPKTRPRGSFPQNARIGSLTATAPGAFRIGRGYANGWQRSSRGSAVDRSLY
jgi:hypothetical protein